ncbi:MAG: hypothetical protein LBH07_01915 [Treponema sp.]|nr:hypothetical protein [Treponema sp.]
MMCLIFCFFAFVGFPAFTETSIQEEVDYLLFLPNRGNQFANEEQAVIQLDNAAKYLLGRNLTSGQIHVYGYAAAAANKFDSEKLSRDRALFVINELQKRGVPGGLFADPEAYGAVDLWGNNANEAARIPNRRVSILIESNNPAPAVTVAVYSEVKTPIMDNKKIPIRQANLTGVYHFRFPWEILLAFLVIVMFALIIFLLFKNSKTSGGNTGFPVNNIFKKEKKSMTFFNDHFLPIIQKHIDQMRADSKEDFRTVDIIRHYIGHYYADGTNVHDSINANIGRFLAENADSLGIAEKAAGQPVTDDKGNHSQTAVWEFI